jgi:glycosyltransferase involved in cell wall biosynthesis
MTTVSIGIYLDEDVRRLDATLAGLAAHTEMHYDLVLLPDDVDAETIAALSRRGIQVAAPGGSAAGAPVWFNRLAAHSRSDVIVFLEAGAVPGPRWLEAVLEALQSDRSNGLGGPTTNSAWNEQGAMRGGGGTIAEVALTAQTAVRHFGTTWRSLEPLYSLSDFCYAVKREVIEAVGGADEQYSRGPCWEMDYNIRAARAGYRGVWARGAYVYRAPFSPRRAREERLRLEASKHRYQDKFCALRLRGESLAYEPHCRGDACEHFAPRDRIQLHMPLPAASDALSPLRPPSVAVGTACRVSQPVDGPLVSCVMVTGNRSEFALQAIRYFERQDYTNRELVIVDDGSDDLASNVASSPRIRYLRVRPGLTIGDKRNRGCEQARGTVITQWDDDDWYGSNRLTAQAEPILAGAADITGLAGTIFLDLPRWKFWMCSPELHRRLFTEDVHGGTLMYRREVWEKNRYPNASLAEDAALLRSAVYRGARLRRIPGSGLFLYVRHTKNTWSFECGRHLDPAAWTIIEPPNLAEDLGFYLSHSSAGGPSSPAGHPLVSCIMPTANRRAFVPQALHCFARQTYENRELIILDDGSDPVQDLIPEDSRITYRRIHGRSSLGAKRNQACEMARGDIIVHWDDDDWMADWRLTYQVNALAANPQSSTCGLSNLYFCHWQGERAWLYAHPPSHRTWIAGATMCYRKSLWRQFRFQEINEGEDTRFIWSIPPGAVLPLPNYLFYVATVHNANTSLKRTADSRWQPRPASEIRQLLGDSWESFFGQSTSCCR